MGNKSVLRIDLQPYLYILLFAKTEVSAVIHGSQHFHTSTVCIGGEMEGGQRELKPPPPNLKEGTPLIFQMCILFSMPYTIQLSSEGLRNTL